MIRPISSVLVDFGRPPTRPSMPSFAFDNSPPQHAEIDVDELTREAEERGYERGRSEASAEMEGASAATQETLAQQVEEQIAEARRQWTTEEGERLVARLDKAVIDLRDHIAAKAAEVLQTLVEPAVKERMISELVETIDHLTRQDATMLLRVEGPADLLEAIRKGLVGHVRSLDLVEGKGPDVRVLAQDSVIETCLGAWLSGHQHGGET
jgi:hypothetical protein